jgi:hypothetical protein
VLKGVLLQLKHVLLLYYYNIIAQIKPNQTFAMKGEAGGIRHKKSKPMSATAGFSARDGETNNVAERSAIDELVSAHIMDASQPTQTTI